MTDTPTTDAVVTHFDLEEYCLADEMRKLEIELNAANERIKLLEAANSDVQRIANERNEANQHIRELIFAGNALREWCEVFYDRNSTTTEQARLIKRDIQQWSQATQ